MARHERLRHLQRAHADMAAAEAILLRRAIRGLYSLSALFQARRAQADLASALPLLLATYLMRQRYRH